MFLPLGGHLLFQNKDTVPPFASDCCFLRTWGGREGGRRGLSSSPSAILCCFPAAPKHGPLALSPLPSISGRGFGGPGRALEPGAAAGPAHLITNVARHLHKPWPGSLLAGPAEVTSSGGGRLGLGAQPEPLLTAGSGPAELGSRDGGARAWEDERGWGREAGSWRSGRGGGGGGGQGEPQGLEGWRRAGESGVLSRREASESPARGRRWRLWGGPGWTRGVWRAAADRSPLP